MLNMARIQFCTDIERSQALQNDTEQNCDGCQKNFRKKYGYG